MKFRGHGSGVAVVLSIVAVVLASGGTAVAVTLAQTTIVDPTTPSHAAKVDTGGHLSVAETPSTIDSTGYVYGYTASSYTVVISPTTAKLAISRIEVSSPTANSAAAEQQLSLSKYPVGTDGTCQTSLAGTLVARYNVTGGDDIVDALAQPIVVKPSGSAKYCMAFFTTYLGSSTTPPPWYLVYGIAASVTTGTYTGTGDGTAPAAVNQPKSARVAH